MSLEIGKLFFRTRNVYLLADDGSPPQRSSLGRDHPCHERPGQWLAPVAIRDQRLAG